MFAALTFGAALVLPGAALATHDPGGDLLPDLVTMRPRYLAIEFSGSEKRLRFRNEVANRHNGPLEIFPEANDSGDCSGDGSSFNDRVVYQRIFDDADGNGYFTRGTDTGPRTRRAGCMIYHSAHNHWHFDAFAQYELRDVSGNLVRRGAKQSFCIEDYGRSCPNLTGSPSPDYYLDCDSLDSQGISVGWSDVYRNHLPGQYLVVTGVSSGQYCLFSTADPDNLLSETNNGNNRNYVRLRLSSSSAGVVTGECRCVSVRYLRGPHGGRALCLRHPEHGRLV